MFSAIRPVRNDYGRALQSFYRAAGKLHSSRKNRSIVSNKKVESFAVSSKSDRGNAPIQILDSFYSCGCTAAIRGNQRQMVHVVGAKAFFIPFKKGDPFPIGTPFRAPSAPTRYLC